MKKIVLVILVLLSSTACFRRPLIVGKRFEKFDAEYDKEIYYTVNNKIYYSKDLKLDKSDKLICDGAYNAVVSPNYFYLLVQKKDKIVLYDKTGKKHKEFHNFYINTVQWDKDSRRIMFLKRTNDLDEHDKSLGLYLYDINKNKSKLIKNAIPNFFYLDANRSTFYYHIKLQSSNMPRFYFSKDGKHIYYAEYKNTNSVFHGKIKDNILKINIYTLKITSNLDFNSLNQKISNDIFVYYKHTDFLGWHLKDLLSHDLKKHIFFYVSYKNKSNTGLWLKEKGKFRRLLKMTNPVSFKGPGKVTFSPIAYFLPENRYFCFYFDFHEYRGIILYDIKTMRYKKILDKKLISYYIKWYFRYIFPISSNDVKTNKYFIFKNRITSYPITYKDGSKDLKRVQTFIKSQDKNLEAYLKKQRKD